MVLALGMANGLGIMLGMSSDVIINGFKQYLCKFDVNDAEGMFNFIVELSNNQRYSPWIERGGLMARDFMEQDQGPASLMKLAMDYCNARD
jgi:hypothetical protein